MKRPGYSQILTKSLIEPLSRMDIPNEPEYLSYFKSARRIQIHFNNMLGAMTEKYYVMLVENVIENMSKSVIHIELCGMNMFYVNEDKKNKFKEKFKHININFRDGCACPYQDGYNKFPY